MKTIDDIQKEIARLRNNGGAGSGVNPDPKTFKKLKERVDFLTDCKEYLLTDPREDFLVAEAERLEKKIQLVQSEYTRLYEDVSSSKHKTWYEKEYGVPQARRQLLNIQYLLSP